MAFRENLLRKIQIDQLASRVLATIGASGSEVNLDKEAMRQLLALSPYAPQRVRDLDLYVEDSGTPVKKILVLDNELPIYRTTVADVAMRKSPTKYGTTITLWSDDLVYAFLRIATDDVVFVIIFKELWAFLGNRLGACGCRRQTPTSKAPRRHTRS